MATAERKKINKKKKNREKQSIVSKAYQQASVRQYGGSRSESGRRRAGIESGRMTGSATLGGISYVAAAAASESIKRNRQLSVAEE